MKSIEIRTDLENLQTVLRDEQRARKALEERVARLEWLVKELKETVWLEAAIARNARLASYP